MNIKQAAAYLDISVAALYQRINRGKYEHKKNKDGEILLTKKALNIKPKPIKDMKIGVRLTENQLKRIKKKAGKTPLASWIRALIEQHT
jgi:predicted DNA binding CopG/RHH family protein